MTHSDALAAAAVKDVRSGMMVGMGTGRAATRGIHALAQRVAAEKLDIQCVATSQASDELGRTLGLCVRSMREVESVDYLFDGADEVDDALRMIKGGGGALTREKIVAHASAQRVYLVQTAKLVAHLGVKFPLPIEVMDFGMAAARRHLRSLGLDGPLRRNADGTLYETDNGNRIIDAPLFPDADVAALATALDGMPGVVGHGLFLIEADILLIEDETGRVSQRSRPKQA
jgi:ribose 5-phosphate isomerase A